MGRIGHFPRRAAILLLSVIVLATIPAPAGADHRALAAGWRFNEDGGQIVRDASGHGHHGLLGSTRGDDPNDPERIDGALRFDGGDYVQIRGGEALGPERVVVHARVRSKGTPGPFGYVLAKGADTCEAASYGLYTAAAGGLAFYVYDGTAFHVSADVGAALWDGEWHRVVGMFTGRDVRLYVDGHQVGVPTPAPVKIDYDLPTSDALTIGSYRGTCELGFYGDIDDVAVFDPSDRRRYDDERDDD